MSTQIFIEKQLKFLFRKGKYEDKTMLLWAGVNKAKNWDEYYKEYKEGKRFFYVIEFNNCVIGEAWLILPNSNCFLPEIHRLGIDPIFRRLGLGEWFINQIQIETKKLGFTKIGLGVETDNEIALNLYLKNDFKKGKIEQDSWLETDPISKKDILYKTEILKMEKEI